MSGRDLHGTAHCRIIFSDWKECEMLFHIKLYAISLTAFFMIDIVWLGFIARSFYRKHLGYILAENPNWTAAILFYLLFVAGIQVFVIAPALASGSFVKMLPLAAFFGLITYATFDLTCLALVDKWPVIVTVVDMVWGTVLSTAVSCVGYWAGKWLSVSS